MYRRIYNARPQSQTLNEFFLRNTLLPVHLNVIAQEALGINHGGIRNDGLFFQEVPFIRGAKGWLQIKYIETPDYAKRFRSIIDLVELDEEGTEFIRIWISNHEKIKPESKWFYLAVEVAHLLLHKDLLEIPNFERSPKDVINANDEAFLFAQLCLWPIKSIFPGNNQQKQRSDDDLVKILCSEYNKTYEQYNLKYPRRKAAAQCWSFLNRLRLHLPEYYKQISNF
ncbi:MAG: hypothetical protein P9M14_15895 [Candidatus Alcyoniella australis]|nr:hypothetical protein [Candidatus Alcyoniella australis]